MLWGGFIHRQIEKQAFTIFIWFVKRLNVIQQSKKDDLLHTQPGSRTARPNRIFNQILFYTQQLSLDMLQNCCTEILKFCQLKGLITAVSKSLQSRSFLDSRHPWKPVKCCYFCFSHGSEPLDSEAQSEAGYRGESLVPRFAALFAGGLVKGPSAL